MGATSIEWTGHTINPLRARLKSDPSKVGHFCEKVSSGCTFCYSSRFQSRRGLPPFGGVHGRGRELVEPFLDVSKLKEVLRRRTPTTYFWCDMTDMFGSWVPNEHIAACFGVMAATPQHTHQVLTKRAERLPSWFAWLGSDGKKYWQIGEEQPSASVAWYARTQGMGAEETDRAAIQPWPLRNVWLGVSAERRQEWGERVGHLRGVPAAVRFVSAEPLLEDLGAVDLSGISWVICGAESGPSARPMDISWMRSIRKQCAAAGVAFFGKQLGAGPVWDGCAVSGEMWPWGTKKEDLQGMWSIRLKDRKGGDPAEWPEDLRVREMPEVSLA